MHQATLSQAAIEPIGTKDLCVKILTWNINGVRARGKQVEELVGLAAPDVLCLQEIKASPEQIEEDVCYLPELSSTWHGQKGGYSGVSVHVRRRFGKAHIEVPAIDRETRMVVAEIAPKAEGAESLTVASVYAPNGGKDYDAKIAFYKDFIEWAAQRKDTPLVITGDLNIAHADLDLHPSQRKEGVIGQRPEERALFSQLLERGGLVDAGRALHPDDDRMFTWWPYWKMARERNLGWRIDYILVSASLRERIQEARVLADFGTSDHAPFCVELDW